MPSVLCVFAPVRETSPTQRQNADDALADALGTRMIQFTVDPVMQNEDDVSESPPRCGGCGKPLVLVLDRRSNLDADRKHHGYRLQNECSCGAVLEMSSDELYDRVVEALKAYYHIDAGGQQTEDS